jgi:hypothetical protein
MARKATGAENQERHANLCALPTWSSTSSDSSLLALESSEVAIRVEERNAVGPKSSREAEASSTPREA